MADDGVFGTVQETLSASTIAALEGMNERIVQLRGVQAAHTFLLEAILEDIVQQAGGTAEVCDEAKRDAIALLDLKVLRGKVKPGEKDPSAVNAVAKQAIGAMFDQVRSRLSGISKHAGQDRNVRMQN
jgi:hypothetical protein